MLIFIDESGTFQVPPSRPNAISCVAALVVPDPFAATLFRKFRKTVRPWRRSGEREVRGRDLDEGQVAMVLKNLRRFDVLAFATCVDMGLHTESGLANHKNHQADKFVERVDEMTPGLRRDAEALAASIRALPNQLYVQAVALTELVYKVIQIGTLYYVQRLPKALGRFRWRVDAKGAEITKYEKLWREIVLALVQAMSLKDPLVQLEGADYSAFARFNNETVEPPAYLRSYLPEGTTQFNSSDLRLLLRENLKFAASHRYIGLQIADVVSNAIQRACNGKMRVEGWGEIGRLMAQAEKGKNALRFISLESITISQPLPYSDVAKRCDEDCKRVMAET